MKDIRYFEVAVAAPLPVALTYSTAELENCTGVSRGSSVVVPLGSRKTTGVILREIDKPESIKTKSIFQSHPERPPLSENYLKWLQWLSGYYFFPLGQVIDLSFPPLAKQTKTRQSKRAAVIPQVSHREPPRLTEEQQAVVTGIQSHHGFQTHLLFGVTGSGKTEVYLRLLETTLANGGSCLVLVPEISLTPQLISRFVERFPDQVAVIHSHLTEREKTNQWWLAQTGEKKILVGARSALFCPLPNLQLIILDEEHEPSFKQDEKLKYHARDSAIMLAKILNIPVVLGSATPSLESYQRALEGRYVLHQMTKRVQERSLPQVEVVDLRQERRERSEHPSDLPYWLSERLFTELHSTLGKHEQSALFLNRRGLAQVALCESCGFTHECPNCAISLTVHYKTHLVCHYCDYAQELKPLCPSCHEGEVKPLGLGTEKVEADMAILFPQARIARADRDEIQSREELEDLIGKMEKHEIDILIGTQMIAKGLDFPKLNLVGLVMADIGFHIPDFRATERSFQLIVQVSGRAGRHSLDPGRVVIQTYDPSHVSVEQAKSGSFQTFAQMELHHRQALRYPPFGKLALIRLQGLDENVVADCAERIARRAQQLKALKPEFAQVMLLGPAPAPIARLRSKFRFQCLIKSPDAKLLNSFCRRVLSDGKWIARGVKLQVDIDPVNMM